MLTDENNKIADAKRKYAIRKVDIFRYVHDTYRGHIIMSLVLGSIALLAFGIAAITTQIYYFIILMIISVAVSVYFYLKFSRWTRKINQGKFYIIADECVGKRMAESSSEGSTSVSYYIKFRNHSEYKIKHPDSYINGTCLESDIYDKAYEGEKYYLIKIEGEYRILLAASQTTAEISDYDFAYKNNRFVPTGSILGIKKHLNNEIKAQRATMPAEMQANINRAETQVNKANVKMLILFGVFVFALVITFISKFYNPISLINAVTISPATTLIGVFLFVNIVKAKKALEKTYPYDYHGKTTLKNKHNMIALGAFFITVGNYILSIISIFMLNK